MIVIEQTTGTPESHTQYPQAGGTLSADGFGTDRTPKTVGDLVEVLQRLDPNEPIRAAEDHVSGMSHHCEWVIGVWHLPSAEEFLAIVFTDGSGFTQQ